jgi:Flp pilus assembly protein TadG
MLRRLYHLGSDRAGTAGIEFAIVLPVMLIFSLVALEATLAVMASMCLSNAAISVANLVAQQSNVNASSIANFCTAGQLSMTPWSGSPLKIAIASVTNYGAGPRVDWQDTSCGSAGSISNATTLATGLIPKKNDSVIVVQASYRYTSPIQYLITAAINMTQNSVQRPRSGSNVSHT